MPERPAAERTEDQRRERPCDGAASACYLRGARRRSGECARAGNRRSARRRGGRSHDERSPAPPPPPASSRRRRRAAPPPASRRGGGRADCDVLAAGAAGPRGWHGGAARVSPGGEAAAPRGRREAHPLLRCPSALPQVCALMVSSGGGRSPVLELRVWVAALRHSAALSRHLFEVQHADGKPWRSLSLSYKAAKSSHLTV